MFHLPAASGQHRKPEGMALMRLLPYGTAYTAARVVVLSWLSRVRGRSAERGSASVGAARRTRVAGGQRPRSARPTVAGRTRSAHGAMLITPTARRIAHAHNCCGPALSGGLLGFDSEGRGGAWYSGPLPAVSGDRLPGPTRPSERSRRAELAERAGNGLRSPGRAFAGFDFRSPS